MKKFVVAPLASLVIDQGLPYLRVGEIELNGS